MSTDNLSLKGVMIPAAQWRGGSRMRVVVGPGGGGGGPPPETCCLLF